MLAHTPRDQTSLALPGLHQAAVIIERMVSQNIYDEIIQGTTLSVTSLKMYWLIYLSASMNKL